MKNAWKMLGVRLINIKYILRKQLIFNLNLIDLASQGWF